MLEGRNSEFRNAGYRLLCDSVTPINNHTTALLHHGDSCVTPNPSLLTPGFVEKII